MPKQNPKASPLGRLHQDSVKRNAYDKGPKPAPGHYSSMGSVGKPEPEKKKGDAR